MKWENMLKRRFCGSLIEKRYFLYFLVLMGNSFIEDWTHQCYLSGWGFGCQLGRSSPSIVALSGLVVRVTCFNKNGANCVQLVRALSALCVTLLLNTLNRTADVKVVPRGRTARSADCCLVLSRRKGKKIKKNKNSASSAHHLGYFKRPFYFPSPAIRFFLACPPFRGWQIEAI